MSTSVVESRPASGPSSPPPGVWEIDPTHSNVEFVVRHFFGSVRGRFREFAGSVTIGETPELSRVEATIVASSVDTQLAQRDEHLRGADFLGSPEHPEMTFRSLAVRRLGADRLAVEGELTIAGQTQPVVLRAQLLGWVNDPWGGQRASFSARAEIDRHDFGMTWNVAAEAGGFVLGRTVRVEIEAELVRRAA